MLPNFVIIGAMKGGSTALFRYLSDHPDVYMAPQKELHFFSEQNWWRGVAWYEEHFEDARGARAVGEASPGYSRWPVSPDSAPNMASVIPDARLVYVIRHPVERLVSHYRHQVQRRDERRPIDEALKDERVYLSTSRYARQIDRYLEFFPREQLLVIRSEDLRERRTETLARVYGFLDVDPSWRPRNITDEFNRGELIRREGTVTKWLRANPVARSLKRFLPAGVSSKMWRLGSTAKLPEGVQLELPPDTRERVVAALQDDLRRLREHLGADFDCWNLLDTR